MFCSKFLFRCSSFQCSLPLYYSDEYHSQFLLESSTFIIWCPRAISLHCAIIIFCVFVRCSASAHRYALYSQRNHKHYHANRFSSCRVVLFLPLLSLHRGPFPLLSCSLAYALFPPNTRFFVIFHNNTTIQIEILSAFPERHVPIQLWRLFRVPFHFLLHLYSL